MNLPEALTQFHNIRPHSAEVGVVASEHFLPDRFSAWCRKPQVVEANGLARYFIILILDRVKLHHQSVQKVCIRKDLREPVELRLDVHVCDRNRVCPRASRTSPVCTRGEVTGHDNAV